MTAQPDMTRHELTQAILTDDLTKFTTRALEALEEIVYVDMQQFPTADAKAAWEKVNAEIGCRAEPLVFVQFDKGDMVRIDPDAETCYASRTGVVESQHPETGTVVVALDNGPWHSSLKMPFAASEVRQFDA